MSTTLKINDIHKPLTSFSRLLCMFIAANTRWPATTSSVFEFDFEMEFLEILATKCVKGRFNNVTVQVKTNLVHTSDSA